jgi:thioredoxin-related protein
MMFRYRIEYTFVKNALVKLKYTILLVMSLFLIKANSQIAPIYDVTQNADSALNTAIIQASLQAKHVLVQVGGNWCPWCRKLDKYMKTQSEIDSIIKSNYIVIHVNYSKENKNLQVMKRLGWPQRFGFPVLVVLDAKGNRLHTQDSGLLESGDGYDLQKVITFLKNWGPNALDPAKYQ